MAMKYSDAKRIVWLAALDHWNGGGMGPGHAVPEGKARTELKEAMTICARKWFGYSADSYLNRM